MMNFETCRICSHICKLMPEQMKPMVLSGDDTKMQCDVCNNSFKLPDCEAVREMARHQRCVHKCPSGRGENWRGRHAKG